MKNIWIELMKNIPITIGAVPIGKSFQNNNLRIKYVTAIIMLTIDSTKPNIVAILKNAFV